MKLKEILEGVPVLRWAADPELELTDLTADSRQVTPGSLFLAIPGSQVDGHRFLSSARSSGALAALTQRPTEELPYVQVENTYRAMARVAANFWGHPTNRLHVIGVTGTNGKTTTTYLIKHLLETVAGAKVGLIGTNQNMIGQQELPTHNTTPDGVQLQRLFHQMVEAGCTWCVMEVSSHALDQGRVDCVRFEMGLFTNLTQDHLDYHGTMEAYCQAKARLFQQCPRGALNGDDPASRTIQELGTSQNLWYGVHMQNADLRAEEVQCSRSGVHFTAVTAAERVPVSLGIPGSFSVYNALTALSAGLLAGLPLAELAKALGTAVGVKGRMEVVPVPLKATVLLDYAHTPDALENALTALRNVSEGRLVVLFGCGGDRDRGKRPKMGAIAARLADFVIVTSDNPRTEEPDAIIQEILAGVAPGDRNRVQVISDRRAAIRWALSNTRPGDTLLLAGKGQETYQEINHVRHHLDEREEIAAFFGGEAAWKQ